MYVDDIILVGNNHQPMTSFKTVLDTQFKPEVLKHFEVFLNGGCNKYKRSFFMSKKYALDVLKDDGYPVAKPILFPIDQNLRLSKLEGDLIDNPSTYRKLIGRLIY